MHNRTRIKMCGLTREKDVEAGVNAGLDALGFIFYEKSPRNVYPDFVRAVVSKVPPFVDCVGVFVNRERREVEEIIEYCGLSHAQLHGKEGSAMRLKGKSLHPMMTLFMVTCLIPMRRVTRGEPAPVSIGG